LGSEKEEDVKKEEAGPRVTLADYVREKLGKMRGRGESGKGEAEHSLLPKAG